ncbi:DNA repair protein RecN [Nonlabens ulvanivorans]|uniref:DNA repair protein RecN n=1 Tax=Nonlabens ulvanivorans TaxID=906888 RepID=A0A081DA39_NONUL|nr:DNA repair protein RecN [Nonlabens ulvanivorans]
MITGETGAGKSILLGALGLVQGKRADLSAVRDTTRKCVVEAQVEMSSLALDELLESYDLDVEPVCFLRREILPSGKSRAFINDTPVTLATMSEVGNRLIDIHSQHQTLQLASDDFQIDVLQSFVNKLTEKAKEPASFLLDSFRIEWSQYKALKTQLNKWVEEEQLLSKEADYNNFLLEELDNAQLDQLDITALEQENEQLSNVEEIQLVLQEFQSMMDQDDNGLLDQLRLLKNRFTQISKYDSDFENANQRLHTTFLELEDLSEEMSRKADSVEADPARLEIINQRLVLIEQLLKKHHQEDVNGLIVLRDELADKVFTNQNIY